MATLTPEPSTPPPGNGRSVRVSPTVATSHPGDDVAVLETGTGEHPEPVDDAEVVVGAVGRPDLDGRRTVEVVVDGWRFEFVVEDDARAALRDRASRDRSTVGRGGGPTEIRAIIPGRVVSLAVATGDVVEAGQTLLTVEAMKMQNELAAPRAGTVRAVRVGPGSTVEVGDVMVALE